MNREPVTNRPESTNTRRIWLRRVLEAILFCVLWIPIVLSGIENIREQTGKGYGEPWNTIGAKLAGWGFWLVGIFLWYVLVSVIGRFILKKLGFLKLGDS
jgi:hypothetical protein